MQASHSSDPWHLTVVCTKGLSFVRPEKSWRPIVTVFIADCEKTHETLLGCDGQNPNLRAPLVLYEVGVDTKLDIRVWHKSHSKSKNRKKRHLVGSAYVSLGELLKKQERPGADLHLRLSCPGQQKKSPTIRGRQQISATLIIRLHPPSCLTPASTMTLYASSSGPSSGNVSDYESEDAAVASTAEAADEKLKIDTIPNESQIRRRRRKKIAPYKMGSDDECASISCYSSGPSTPRDECFPPFTEADKDDAFERDEGDDAEGWFSPALLPQYVDQLSVRSTLSVAESLVDIFAPYHELEEASIDADYEKVLARLLTEWYVVGASLLALAGIDAAVYGFNNAGTLFDTDGMMQNVTAFGAIAAGLGVVLDAWFLVLYSDASVARFQRRAAGLYDNYFFFCLTCRLPTLCMFLSALCLTVFLLGVAYTKWPAAVLVMSCVAGTLITLQYLVYGFHRLWNFCIWALQRLWWLARGRRGPAAAAVAVVEAPEVGESGVVSK